MKPIRNCEVRIDGASLGNPGPAGIGVVFLDGRARPIRQRAKYLGETTNNVAEYSALVYALQEARALGCRRLRVKTDSELLARQLSGQYKVRNAQLRILHDLAKSLAQEFTACQIEHIPRTQNRLADRLAGQAAKQRQ
jgi:ribonuclease HI